MRILGLDIGNRRIGIAMSPETPRIAVPYLTIEYTDEQDAIRRLKELFAKEEVAQVVYGMPVAMDGGMGEQALITDRFVKKLAEGSTIEFIPRNERYTTHAARKSMFDLGMKRKNRKKLVDRLAAVIILQGYLDSLSIGGSS